VDNEIAEGFEAFCFFCCQFSVSLESRPGMLDRKRKEKITPTGVSCLIKKNFSERFSGLSLNGLGSQAAESETLRRELGVL
jgi:hypothetical protein